MPLWINMQKNLQVDNYQVDFNEFETFLPENLGLQNFDSSQKAGRKHYCSISLKPAFQIKTRNNEPKRPKLCSFLHIAP